MQNIFWRNSENIFNDKEFCHYKQRNMICIASGLNLILLIYYNTTFVMQYENKIWHILLIDHLNVILWLSNDNYTNNQYCVRDIENKNKLARVAQAVKQVLKFKPFFWG